MTGDRTPGAHRGPVEQVLGGASACSRPAPPTRCFTGRIRTGYPGDHVTPLVVGPSDTPVIITVSDKVRQRIEACGDLDTLETWIRRSGKVNRAEDLFDRPAPNSRWPSARAHGHRLFQPVTGPEQVSP